MGRVDRYPGGTFCWLDLGTTDVEGAKRFYRELFGWELADVPAGDGTYTIARVDGLDVAGLHEHSPEEGVGWSSYVAVYDIHEATRRAAELGATDVEPPAQIPGVAWSSTLRDPVGAGVTLWQAEGHVGARLVNEIGTWCWNELVAPDLGPAVRFYEQLFTWTAERVPAPIERLSFTMGDLLIGGAHAATPGEPAHPRWDVAFRVADPDRSVARVLELGGRVLLPPADIPVGRFAVVSDPAGAALTLTAFAGPTRGADGS